MQVTKFPAWHPEYVLFGEELGLELDLKPGKESFLPDLGVKRSNLERGSDNAVPCAESYILRELKIGRSIEIDQRIAGINRMRKRGS